MVRRRAPVAAFPLLAGACSYQHYQSTFSSAATEVRQFNTLFLVFLFVCLAVVWWIFKTGYRLKK